MDFWYGLVVAVEILLIIFFAYSCSKKKMVISKSNLWYFIPVFLVVFTNYCFGYFYNGLHSINFIGFAKCFADSFKVFVLNIEGGHVQELISANVLFSISFHLGAVMASFTMFSSAIALIRDLIKNNSKVNKALKSSCDIILFDEEHEEDINFYLTGNKNVILWIDKKLSNKEVSFYVNKKLPIINLPFTTKNILEIKYNDAVDYHYIVFKKEVSEYAGIFKAITPAVKEKTNLYFHIESTPQYLDVVREDFISKNNIQTYVNCFSRAELIARKLNLDHPMSKYLPREYINDNCTLKKDANINCLIIGYGNIGKEVCRLSVINNQFVGQENDKLKAHNVNYYIYDKDNKISKPFTKYINIDKLVGDASKYIGLPEEIVKIEFVNGNCEEQSIVLDIISKVANSSFSYIVISTSDEFLNNQLAKEIYNYLDAIGAHSKSRMFIAANTDNFKNNPYITAFGTNDEIICHDVIVNEKLAGIAKLNHETYNKNHNLVGEQYSWNNLSLTKQFSNIYASINIGFKLNLLGLDLTNFDSEGVITKEEYMELYNPSNINSYVYEDYFKVEKRNVLAFQEHLRWCAMYVVNGFLPLSKDRIIKKANGGFVTKDEDVKKHACLLTYYDLAKLDEYLVELSENKLSVQDVETYKYDYQIMDGIYEYLSDLDYKIIKRK